MGGTQASGSVYWGADIESPYHKIHGNSTNFSPWPTEMVREIAMVGKNEALARNKHLWPVPHSGCVLIHI